jgi:peroxidase
MYLTEAIIENALQDPSLSQEDMAALKAMLEDIQNGKQISVEDIYDLLPMAVLAQAQAIIEPAAGEPTPQAHGRLQDAQSFMFEATDATNGKANGAEKYMNGLNPQPSSDLPLYNVLTGNASFASLADPTDNYGMMMVKQTPSPHSVIFSEIEETLPLPSFADFEFRTITAQGNNVANETMGSTGTVYMTVAGYAYEDGISMPHDFDRPSPREISNVLFEQSGNIFSNVEASNFLWVWGQFVDHDITLTREGHSESYNIDVPMGDPYFDPYGTGTQEISLSRSGYMPGTGESAETPRAQVNDITAFIDASNVYGSTQEVEASLRGEDGKLLLSEDGLLPVEMGSMGPEFSAGDVRANENIGLTSMHTLFAREHNYWVDQIAEQHPEFTDDQLYQAAKSIVEAEIQNITYYEFLPALLGENALSTYEGYNPDIDAQIANEFSTAAFRVGHTMLSSDIFRLSENGDESDLGNLTLQNAFFRPDIIMTGGIDEIIRGLGGSMAQNIDASIIDDVRNFLFGPPGAGGFDLVSLNIQRGRDHGLPDFNSVREAYGLDPYDNFDDMVEDAALATKLTQLYGDISHMDLWVGGLIESPYGDALVGETFFTIIADQFTRLRDGDRFWFEGRFDDGMVDFIHDTTLSDIIQRNTDIDHLQNDIFSSHTRIGGDDSNDTLVGTDGSDLIIGFAGNDAINGGLGSDALYGSNGIDRFIFDVLDGNVDTIRDFSVTQDRIDLSALLTEYNPADDVIADFVQFTTQDGNTTIAVDIDGNQNEYSFQDVVILEDVVLAPSAAALMA